MGTSAEALLDHESLFYGNSSATQSRRRVSLPDGHDCARTRNPTIRDRHTTIYREPRG